MKIRFRIQPTPRFLKLLGAKDQIVVQVPESTMKTYDYAGNKLEYVAEWRDATPEDMVHVHEGTVA